MHLLVHTHNYRFTCSLHNPLYVFFSLLEARVLFKDYVNSVAYVSQESNTKYLILRPEARDILYQSQEVSNVPKPFHEPVQVPHSCDVIPKKPPHPLPSRQYPTQPPPPPPPIPSHSLSLSIPHHQTTRQLVSHSSDQQQATIEPPPRMRHSQNLSQQQVIERPLSTISLTSSMISPTDENRYSHISWPEPENEPPQPPPRRRSVTSGANISTALKLQSQAATVTACPAIVDQKNIQLDYQKVSQSLEHLILALSTSTKPTLRFTIRHI